MRWYLPTCSEEQKKSPYRDSTGQDLVVSQCFSFTHRENYNCFILFHKLKAKICIAMLWNVLVHLHLYFQRAQYLLLMFLHEVHFHLRDFGLGWQRKPLYIFDQQEAQFLCLSALHQAKEHLVRFFQVKFSYMEKSVLNGSAHPGCLLRQPVMLSPQFLKRVLLQHIIRHMAEN